jgi:hypothetical protein
MSSDSAHEAAANTQAASTSSNISQRTSDQAASSLHQGEIVILHDIDCNEL